LRPVEGGVDRQPPAGLDGLGVGTADAPAGVVRPWQIEDERVDAAVALGDGVDYVSGDVGVGGVTRMRVDATGTIGTVGERFESVGGASDGCDGDALVRETGRDGGTETGADADDDGGVHARP